MKLQQRVYVVTTLVCLVTFYCKCHKTNHEVWQSLVADFVQGLAFFFFVFFFQINTKKLYSLGWFSTVFTQGN